MLLQIDIDDVITINPELTEELRAADLKENLPLQENVTVQVSILVSPKVLTCQQQHALDRICL